MILCLLTWTLSEATHVLKNSMIFLNNNFIFSLNFMYFNLIGAFAVWFNNGDFYTILDWRNFFTQEGVSRFSKKEDWGIQVFKLDAFHIFYSCGNKAYHKMVCILFLMFLSFKNKFYQIEVISYIYLKV